MNDFRAHVSLARVLTLAAILTTFALVGVAQVRQAEPSKWESYLDYAYVYSSADPKSLAQRVAQYGREAGLTLEEHLYDSYESYREEGEGLDEPSIRRLAIGYFLLYLVDRNLEYLDKAVDVIEPFESQEGRHENAYWYHYIMAHRAMEKGKSSHFVRHNLDLWLDVVVPLESAYETLDALSLSQSPNSGFVSALPYILENQAR